jgi:DNA-directed RNA polymerase subunit M/transcription elongation factor TFIIS
MDPYLIAFLLIVGLGIVVGYAYYLKEKHEQLRAIESGICPKCGQKSIELTDQRGAGCGSKMVSFRCTVCEYENTFNV